MIANQLDTDNEWIHVSTSAVIADFVVGELRT